MAPAPLIVRPIDDDAFVARASAAGVPVPLEQSPVWDRFDASAAGRSHLGRFVVGPQDGDPVALVSLTSYSVRGFPYLWGRHAPIMLTEPTAETEGAVHYALAEHARREWTDVVFIRLHAHHPSPELRPLLQTVTYDRTVVIDMQQPADDYLASLSKKFRYTVRQALKHDDVVVADETDASAADFSELYGLYEETAERDGFGIYDAEVYRGMIEALAPHARVFVARRTGGPTEGDASPQGRAIAWAIVTHYDGAATYLYAAANAEARDLDAGVRLLWDLLAILREEGVRTFDMGGVDSPLAPTLAGVGMFKRKWGTESEVPPAWDLPIKRSTYALFVAMLRLKRALRGRR